MAKKKNDTEPVKNETDTATEVPGEDTISKYPVGSAPATAIDKKPDTQENRGVRKAKTSATVKKDAERLAEVAEKVRNVSLDGARQDVLKRILSDPVAKGLFVALLDRRRNGEHDPTGGREDIAAMAGRVSRATQEIFQVIESVLQHLASK